jgi:transposase-like protein
MKKQRRKFSKEFKLKVILEALKERETIQQLSQRFEIHPQQITNWKKDYLDKSLEIMDVKSNKESVESIEREKEKLYEKIGKLQMEVDFLKKNVKL